MHRSQFVSRTLDFLPLEEEMHDDGANHFVATVLELTGKFVTKIECDGIMEQSEEEETPGFDPELELVYFGTLENLDDPLEVKASGEHTVVDTLKLVSMVERYEYLDEYPSTEFYVVEDPACATKYGLDPSKPNIGLFVKNSEFRKEPFFFTKEGDAFHTASLLEFIQVSAVRAFPKYDKRSISTIFDFLANGLFYVMPKIPDEPKEL